MLPFASGTTTGCYWDRGPQQPLSKVTVPLQRYRLPASSPPCPAQMQLPASPASQLPSHKTRAAPARLPPQSASTQALRPSCITGMPLKRPKERQSLGRARLFAAPRTAAHQAPLSTDFSRQENWSGERFPSPGDLPNPGIKPRSPTLQADSLPSEPPGKPRNPLS